MSARKGRKIATLASGEEEEEEEERKKVERTVVVVVVEETRKQGRKKGRRRVCQYAGTQKTERGVQNFLACLPWANGEAVCRRKERERGRGRACVCPEKRPIGEGFPFTNLEGGARVDENDLSPAPLSGPSSPGITSPSWAFSPHSSDGAGAEGGGRGRRGQERESVSPASDGRERASRLLASFIICPTTVAIFGPPSSSLWAQTQASETQTGERDVELFHAECVSAAVKESVCNVLKT